MLGQAARTSGSPSRDRDDTYEAAAGGHDDLVMALCLAVWWAERPSVTNA
jgi:phage FluMu gp28-like protein